MHRLEPPRPITRRRIASTIRQIRSGNVLAAGQSSGFVPRRARGSSMCAAAAEPRRWRLPKSWVAGLRSRDRPRSEPARIGAKNGARPSQRRISARRHARTAAWETKFDVVVCVFGIFFVPDMVRRRRRSGAQSARWKARRDDLRPALSGATAAFWNAVRDFGPISTGLQSVGPHLRPRLVARAAA